MDEHIGGRKYLLTMTVEITIPEDSEYWITEADLVNPQTWEHPACNSVLAEITRIEVAHHDGPGPISEDGA